VDRLAIKYNLGYLKYISTLLQRVLIAGLAIRSNYRKGGWRWQ
jgi:hypothetical protein